MLQENSNEPLANPVLRTALQKLVDDKVKVLVAYAFTVYFWVH